MNTHREILETDVHNSIHIRPAHGTIQGQSILVNTSNSIYINLFKYCPFVYICMSLQTFRLQFCIYVSSSACLQKSCQAPSLFLSLLRYTLKLQFIHLFMTHVEIIKMPSTARQYFSYSIGIKIGRTCAN